METVQPQALKMVSRLLNELTVVLKLAAKTVEVPLVTALAMNPIEHDKRL